MLAASTPLVALHALAASIWVGGLVAIAVVSRAAEATLAPGQRVALFRVVGRAYGIVGAAALLIALASGAILLGGHEWEGLLAAAAVTAGALLAATVAGIAQARAMTRLRRRALADPGDHSLRAAVDRGARVAAVLRGTIAALTLALVVIGSALAE